MKKFVSTIMLGGLLFGGVAAVALPSSVSADIEDACSQYTQQANSCSAGYNAVDESVCDPMTEDQAQACLAGVTQAKKDGKTAQNPGGTTNGSNESKNKCGGAKTEIINCDEEAGLGAISSIIRMVIMILTILIGLVAVGGITYGAILYASARDNQSQVQEAITIIRNVVIGLLLYGFSVAIINWLIPGGVIG